MSGATPSYDELLALTRRQARVIRGLEARLARLQAEADRLRAELGEARRAGKRQAAPFSKGPPEDRPKRPGRTPGHPPAHRAAPPPERVDREIEVPLPEGCPGCQAPLDDVPTTVHDQDQIDLPGSEPVVTRFRAPVARCPLCRRRIQGRHPEQTSDALGAAAVQYGPRPLAVAADLKHRQGVPYRKCAAALGTLCGLVIAPAALVRSGHRLRRLARPSYESLIAAARRSEVQHADETGGKIGGRSAWLWVFADGHATIDLIRRSRGHEVAEEVLGTTYPGVLVSDGFPAYDPLGGLKSKCSAHLLRRCSELARAKVRGAVRFPRRVAALLRRALALKRRRGRIGDHGYAVVRGRVLAEWRRLLTGRYSAPDNARLARRLRKHRDSVLRFLDHDGVDGTNLLAEREVRPAVVVRKLSAGNRTEAGAETHAVLMSVLRTCARQGRDILAAVAALLRRGPGHVLPFDHTAPGDPP
jgi:transposase